jgi:Sulfotransferase family
MQRSLYAAIRPSYRQAPRLASHAFEVRSGLGFSDPQWAKELEYPLRPVLMAGVSSPDLRPISKVLFVGAMGRSGSTVLELMLGAFEGFIGVGELRYIWQMGLVENRLCECGEAFAECSFWQEVGAQAFDGWDIDPQRVLEIKSRFERHRALPALWRRETLAQRDSEFAWYIDVLARLYEGIRTISGAVVIVDSSKIPPYLFTLQKIPSIDLRLLHLVRDPRGVVYSWKKRVARPDVVDGPAYMPTFSTSKSVGLWIDYNGMYHIAGRMGTPRIFLRYEDFIPAPREGMARVLDFLDVSVPEENLGATGGPSVPIRGSHAIGGNPIRFGSREMVLRLDDEWRRELTPAVRRGVYAATWPMARSYGYSAV